MEIPLIVASDQNQYSGIIGQKARGLLDCQPTLIPKFAIITSRLYDQWKTSSDIESSLDQIKLFSEKHFSTGTLILRSSAEDESLFDRGFYESSIQEISVNNIKKELVDLLNKNHPLIEKSNNKKFSIIIQEYIKPKFLGHLSNERHLCKDSYSGENGQAIRKYADTFL